jgi:peptidoglycan/xylan/chitin deacetylase (PgdA/CDA1 family)
VRAFPDTYKQVLVEGHSVGNHTQNHLNGWKTPNDVYMKDVAEAANYIDSNLFRPPYGRISLFQARNLTAAMNGRQARVIMWDVLSADFDKEISNEQSLEFVVLRSMPGSIIVFHDSEKAFDKLTYVLPRVLHHFTGKGFKFLPIEKN